MLFAITFCGAFGAWAYHATMAAGQEGMRRITPEGFEFGAKTRSFKYHFPRKYARGTIYSGTWIAESAEEVRPNFVIYMAEIKPTPETSVLYFSLNNAENDFPPGLYRLEIKADGKLVRTERFFIK